MQHCSKLNYSNFRQLTCFQSRSQQASGRAAHLLRSWVRIPPGAWIFVCCECRVLSGRGLCDELITRPEESYRLCRVVVCDLETSRMGAPYIYDISHLRVNFFLKIWCPSHTILMSPYREVDLSCPPSIRKCTLSVYYQHVFSSNIFAAYASWKTCCQKFCKKRSHISCSM